LRSFAPLQNAGRINALRSLPFVLRGNYADRAKTHDEEFVVVATGAGAYDRPYRGARADLFTDRCGDIFRKQEAQNGGGEYGGSAGNSRRKME